MSESFSRKITKFLNFSKILYWNSVSKLHINLTVERTSKLNWWPANQSTSEATTTSRTNQRPLETKTKNMKNEHVFPILVAMTSAFFNNRHKHRMHYRFQNRCVFFSFVSLLMAFLVFSSQMLIEGIKVLVLMFNSTLRFVFHVFHHQFDMIWCMFFSCNRSNARESGICLHVLHFKYKCTHVKHTQNICVSFHLEIFRLEAVVEKKTHTFFVAYFMSEYKSIWKCMHLYFLLILLLLLVWKFCIKYSEALDANPECGSWAHPQILHILVWYVYLLKF